MSESTDDELVFPDSRVLEYLGGEQDEASRMRTMISGKQKFVRFMVQGAGLWDTDDKEDWGGVFNHLCMEDHACYVMAQKLKERLANQEVQEALRTSGRESYLAEIEDPQFTHKLISGSWMTDSAKRVNEEMKHHVESVGLRFKDKHHLIAHEAADERQLQPEVKQTILAHHFPWDRKRLSLLDKVVLLADQISAKHDGVSYVAPKPRMKDVARRWNVDPYNPDPNDDVTPNRFWHHAKTVLHVADELRELMGYKSVEDLLEDIRTTPEREELQMLRKARKEDTELDVTELVRSIETGAELTRAQLREML